MAISVIDKTSATSGASAVSSLALTYPTLAANDVVVAQVHIASSTATITTPSGWTLIRSDTGNNRRSSLYVKVATGSESGTVAFALSSSVNAVGGMAAFRGVDTTTPIDTSAGQTNGSASTSCTAPTVTATASGGMLLTFSSGVGNVTFTPASGQTEQWDVTTTAGSSNCASELATETLSASGATGTRASTMSGSVTSLGQSVVLKAAGATWINWIERDGQIIQRVGRCTIAAAAGVGYVALSKDGTSWSYFSGPLQADGRTLTSVASQSAAQSAALSLPTNGNWDIPGIVEARYVRLYSRNATDYDIYEFYPRRLTETDDMVAEYVKALFVSTNKLTADQISATAIDGFTITGATIQTAASGQRVMLDATGLRTYDSSGVLQIEASSATNGALTAGAGNIKLNAGGMAITASTAFGPDPVNAVRFVRSSDNSTLGYIAGSQNIALQDVVSVTVFPGSGRTGIVQLTANQTTVSGGLNVGSATGATQGQINASARINTTADMVIGTSGTYGSNVRLGITGRGATSSTYGIHIINSAGTNYFYVDDAGNGYLKAASWTYGSDVKLKKNIKPYDKTKAAPAALKAIAVQQFDYIDGAANQVGYVANDLQAIIPDAVTTGPDGTLAVRSLEPWIVLWLQQQQETIEAQQQQIDTLTQQVQALQAAVDKLTKGKP